MKSIYESADFFMSRHAMLKRASNLPDMQQYFESEPLFKEAVHIASPELAKSAHASEKSEKRTQSLLKYFLRMSSRATPFGLFSAVGWGEFSDNCRLEVNPESVKKACRPDMKWLQEIARLFQEDRERVRHLLVLTNPYLLYDRGRYTLAKLHDDKRKRTAYSINATSFSVAVFQLAKTPILYKELEHQLFEQFKAHEPEKIEQHLWQIFTQDFLLTELSPHLTKTFDMEMLGKTVGSKLHELFIQYSQTTPGKGLDCLTTVSDAMQSFKNVDYPIQVDACQTKESHLPRSIQKEIEEIASLLWHLAPKTGHTHIKKYHEQFLEKYGTRRLVPFLEMVHEIMGIGLPKSAPQDTESLESSLFSCLEQEEFVLDDIVSTWKEPPTDLIEKAPLSMELFFEIDAESSVEIGKGNYTLHLNPTVASSQAGATFGRFFYLWDSPKCEAMRTFLKKEEAHLPHTAFVEASFLPENARTSNVCFQESIRTFQLQLHYHEKGEGSLELSDIYVGATQSNLYLYSKRLEKPLLITLSTAVNSDLAPAFLKLMLDISKAHFSPFNPYPWSMHTRTAYLPRIRYKKAILTPRRWTFEIDESMDRKKAEASLRTWLNEHKIPSNIHLCHFDNRLLINWEESAQFELVLQDLLQKKKVILFEALITKTKQTQEFVVPLVKKRESSQQEIKYPYPQINQLASTKRLYIPGSSWLYLKLFTSQEEEGDFIKDYVATFAEYLRTNHHISKWFYVRYYQEKSHIRLRLNQPSPQLLSLLHSWLSDQLDEGRLGEVAFATYEQEVERYGGPDCMASAEEWFYFDSIACSKLLNASKPHAFIAAHSIICMLDLFFESYEEKFAFLEPLEKEAHLLSGQRETMKSMFNWQMDKSLFEPLKAYVRIINECEAKGSLWNTKKGILDSLIHMHCNRLLGIDNTIEQQARVAGLFFLKRAGRMVSCQ